MCDRLALVVCAAIVVGVSTARAQVRPQAEHRLDSLTAILSATPEPVRPKAPVQSGPGVVPITFDTLPGVLPFVVASNARKFADGAVRAADAQLRHVLGQNPPDFGRQSIKIVANPAPGSDIAIFVSLGVRIGGMASATTDSASIVQAILEAVGALIPNRTDLLLVNWVSRTAVPFDSLRNVDWVRVWSDATRVPNQSVADCLAGKIAVCMTALDIVPPRDTIADWLDSVTIVEIAQRNRAQLRREAPEESVPCLNGVFKACSVVLRVVPQEIHPPMPGTARASLAQFAITTGGEGAAARLMLARGTIAERLAETAGIPAEELVRRWQARVVGQRAGAAFLSGDLVISAILWTLVFVALGLRSSRWR